MTVQTQSKILLSVLIAAGMAPSFYFLAEGYLPYGLTLLLGGLAILSWIWKPWQWFKRNGESKHDSR